CNVGILCGGDLCGGGNLVVLDIDSTEAEDVQWVIDEVGDTPMKVRSPSGGLHLFFRGRASVAYGNGVRLRGKAYDLRWNGTFIVCPWSVRQDGTQYEWLGYRLPVNELPFMRVSPLRARRRTRALVEAVFTEGDRAQLVSRARAYLAKVEPAVSG